MENNIIRIENFKLKVFKNLLKQSLMVNNQIMIEFSQDFIKSCSFNQSGSFMKLWTIPTKSIVQIPEKDENQLEISLEGINDTVVEFDFPVFNMYVLKGNYFEKYLSVFESDIVDLVFNVVENDGKYQATQLSIIGKTELDTKLKTFFTLTTEELISDKVEDYAKIIAKCTPTENMYEIVIGDSEVMQIKKLVKLLHASVVKNSPCLVFEVNGNNLKVKDKSFETEITLPQTKKLPTEQFVFSILKSDFIIAGKHSFSIYASETEGNVIFGTKYGPSIIMCLSTKADDNVNINQDLVDSAIEDLNLSEYGLGDADDLPF